MAMADQLCPWPTLIYMSATRLSNNDNMSASLMVLNDTIKNSKSHSKQTNQTEENTARWKGWNVSHLRISKWTPDNHETGSKAVGAAKHQFLSKTTPVDHQLQQSSQPVRRTVSLLRMRNSRAWQCFHPLIAAASYVSAWRSATR